MVRAVAGHRLPAGSTGRGGARVTAPPWPLLRFLALEWLREGSSAKTAAGQKHCWRWALTTPGTATCGLFRRRRRLHHRGPLQFDSRAGHDHDRRSVPKGRLPSLRNAVPGRDDVHE